MNRALRHAVFGAIGCSVVFAVAGALHGDPIAHRFSMGTAYAALLFLSAALMLGPWYALVQDRRPASTYLRRDIAIWAALLALLHILIGLQVHFDGRWLNYFARMDADRVWLRFDAFGAANYAGLIAGVGLFGLLFISNDASMRILGIARWRRWQSAAPWVGAVTMGHAALYEWIEKRSAFFVTLTAAFVVAVLLMRGARALLADRSEAR